MENQKILWKIQKKIWKTRKYYGKSRKKYGKSENIMEKISKKIQIFIKN
jgi:hypothetical protein